LKVYRQSQRAVRALTYTASDTNESWNGSVIAVYAAQYKAAAAVAADAVGRHTIEKRVGVYLVLGPRGWEIDGVTMDGSPLFGYDNGPVAGELCEHGEELDAECEALAEAAPNPPTAEELTVLLVAAQSDVLGR
jgi:hypothetical protein